MNLRPLHDRVVVQRIDDSALPPGAIIVPDSAKEKPQRGTVIAAGSGKSNADGRRVPLDVKAGDVVLFGKFAGQEHQTRRRGVPDLERRRSPGRCRSPDVVQRGAPMTPVQTPIDVLSATCPLCHTLDHTVRPESLLAGARWACVRCGQKWTAARLETAAAYQRYVAAH